MKKKLILIIIFCMVWMSAIGTPIDTGMGSIDVEAVGVVISSITITNETDDVTNAGSSGHLFKGDSGLNMGIMLAGESRDYLTSENTRDGWPHPAKIKVSGATSTSGNTIITMTYPSETTINNGTTDIAIDLFYKTEYAADDVGAVKTGNENTFPSTTIVTSDAITLSTDTGKDEMNIYIHGRVDEDIPNSTGNYTGTITVEARYDTDSEWF